MSRLQPRCVSVMLVTFSQGNYLQQGLDCHLPRSLLEDEDNHWMRRLFGVFDDAPVILQLEGEGGDVLEHLDALLHLLSGNIHHQPVQVGVWQEPLNPTVNNHYLNSFQIIQVFKMVKMLITPCTSHLAWHSMRALASVS